MLSFTRKATQDIRQYSVVVEKKISVPDLQRSDLSPVLLRYRYSKVL